MSDGNILVVDDDHEIADLVEIHLRGEGYHVFKAYNGREALELFDREEVDLAILDIMMPGIDGNEVCAKIRETSTIPIIMLSAKDSENDKVSGLVNGADDYVRLLLLTDAIHSLVYLAKFIDNKTCEFIGFSIIILLVFPIAILD